MFRRERGTVGLNGHAIVAKNEITTRRLNSDIGYSSEAFLYVIRQAQRKGNDRQRRIKRSTGWEYRAAGHIKVCDPVNAAILVDDTHNRVPLHASRPDMMLVPTHIAWPFAIGVGYSRLESAESATA